MDVSILLARLLGPLFLAAGIGLLVNPAHYRKMVTSFLADPGLYYFSGAAALTVGVAILLFHNLWVADWRVVITIIGWLSVTKGLVRLILPQAGLGIARLLDARAALVAGGIFAAALGAWLCALGYAF